MNLPTPAAVRAAMTYAETGPLMHTTTARFLADHIRAICAEMRARAKRAESCKEYCEACALENFADKLEGREP